MEICNSVKAVKYLYKYVYKGHDKVIVEFRNNINNRGADSANDEIKSFLNARYVSASEGIWRIFGYPLHDEYPNVFRLAIHLEHQQPIHFHDDDKIEDVLASNIDSTLTSWFKLNATDVKARSIIYSDIPKFYKWDKTNKNWSPRARGESNTIGRMYFVQPGEGERYYLRMLLNIVKGAKCFQDIRSIDGYTYNTFKEAAKHRGLLEDDNEWDICLTEAAQCQSGHLLRALFATILLFCVPAEPLRLWIKFKDSMSEDLLFNIADGMLDDIEQKKQIAENLALLDIQKTLEDHQKRLADYPGMPVPTEEMNSAFSKTILSEMCFNMQELIQERNNVKSLNADQLFAFNTIMNDVDNINNEHNLFFIDGPGGTGKTFLYSALLATIRERSEIALAVASSGIAALLLSNGRTAHSRLKIPIQLDEASTCNIKKNSDTAQLIKLTKIIIWDEAPMTHKHAFEALDRSLRDIMQIDKPFGGKVIVFGGDFRQVLPVIRRGTRSDIVQASLKYSYLWDYVKVLKLSINMRVKKLSGADASKQQEFADWLLQIGEGKNFINNENDIELPQNIVHNSNNLNEFLSTVFEDLNSRYAEKDYVINRAILTSKNEYVDIINEKVLDLFPGEEYVYYGSDTVAEEQHKSMYPSEFLNSLTPSGLPPHKLVLKINAPVMLLRNLNPYKGLCNGTRLICKAFHRYMIEAEIATGKRKGDRVFIPRITLIPSDSGLPFDLCRRQFPIRPAFAMTINKSQGQTMTYCGLYIPEPVFSHGQLYVALSRVSSIDSIKVFTKTGTNITKNVVFKEIFRN